MLYQTWFLDAAIYISDQLRPGLPSINLFKREFSDKICNSVFHRLVVTKKMQ